ncbi:MAG: flagellar cap protein, partial [Gammaproteobacteria bacterium]|nr:flagellar cap protein [Gammaproteobacteria bacterium]
MASISSLGIGSGLDIQSLVQSLVTAEGAGKKARLDRREVDYQAKLSIIGSVKGALKDFQTSYSSLRLSSTFKSFTATSSDLSAFTATASKGAEETSYSLSIDQIAKAHKLKTVEQADKTTSIGTGTLQLTQGDGTVTDI